MQNVRLNVQGMSCGHCINAIEGAIGKLGAEAKVDLKSDSVTVYFDETKLTLDKIKETIEDQGYDVV